MAACALSSAAGNGERTSCNLRTSYLCRGLSYCSDFVAGYHLLRPGPHAEIMFINVKNNSPSNPYVSRHAHFCGFKTSNTNEIKEQLFRARVGCRVSLVASLACNRKARVYKPRQPLQPTGSVGYRFLFFPRSPYFLMCACPPGSSCGCWLYQSLSG